jgi:hypothetical protein
MNVFIDIETIPAQPEDKAKQLIAESISAPKTMSKAETIQAWHNGEGKYAGEKEKAIEEKYRKTALDGTTGEIISIAYAIEDGETQCFSRALDGDELTFISLAMDEIDLNLGARPPRFVGHNIRFDLRFLFQRCAINSIHPSFSFKQYGRHATDFFCTMEAWAGFGKFISQDNLCKALGIEGKPSDIDGSKVWDIVKAGDVGRVQEYNADDVEKVRKIYARISHA